MKITLGPAILPAEVALSVFGDCAYTSLAVLQPARHAWLMTLPPPLLLKLWVLPSSFDGQEVEGGGRREEPCFVAAP